MNKQANFYHIKLVFFLLLTGFSIGLSAHSLPNFLIINAGLGKHFGLKIEGLNEQNADFSVKSAKGQVLLRQKISGTDFQGLYNLEGLREGEYIFVLKTNSSEIQQPVRLTKHAIQYQLSDRKVVYYPEVIVKGRQLDVNFMNAARENFTIRLYSGDGKLLYKESFNELTDIEKRLNLLQVPSGEYELKMSTPSGRWTELIVLQ